VKKTNQLTVGKLIELMNKVPLFLQFSLSERTQFAQCADIFVASADEAIIEKGGTDTCFYIMLSGSAKVCPDKNKQPVAQISPGGIFGEVGFALNRPRSTWVIANQLSALIRVDHTLLNNLDSSVREKVKDQIILKLANIIEDFNSRTYQ